MRDHDCAGNRRLHRDVVGVQIVGLEQQLSGMVTGESDSHRQEQECQRYVHPRVRRAGDKQQLYIKLISLLFNAHGCKKALNFVLVSLLTRAVTSAATSSAR